MRLGSVMQRVLVWGLVGVALAPGAAAATGGAPRAFGAHGTSQVPASARSRAMRPDDDEEDDAHDARPARSLGGLLSRRSGLLGTVGMALAFYFLFMRGRGGFGSAGWGSYYLFWIVAPVLIAAVSSHPEVLLVVVVGLVARRWLPDPFLALRYGARIRSLQVDVASNPGNITARRALASLWLERRRPGRALPLVEQALIRDPTSPELLYLRGLSQLQLRQSAPAFDSLLAVVHQDPGFRYGEAYLRAGDALMALGRWDDAEEALDHYLKINSSSVEALCKRARVRKARKDDDGARQARLELREVWRALPSFQRRKQLGWYLRALVLG